MRQPTNRATAANTTLKLCADFIGSTSCSPFRLRPEPRAGAVQRQLGAIASGDKLCRF